MKKKEKISKKIKDLKIQNARKKLFKKFGFLSIIEILNSEEKEGEEFFSEFRNCGIWDYENKAIESFPFYTDEGIIDRELRKLQYKKAQKFFIKKIKALEIDFVWISLSENDYYFFVKIEFSKLFNNLNDWFLKYDDFQLFIPNQYALTIHEAEYEWEILEKLLKNK